jgi:hypothetical protein
VRHTVLDKLCPRWPPWRQASNQLRRVGDAGSSPSELVANDCFGRVAEHERLALEGVVTGERCWAEASAAEPPNQDPTDSVG